MSARRLYLLRHAKSSWADAGLDDHARPLAARGTTAVKGLRQYVASARVAPDLVLCSSARRTVMTLEGIAEALPADVVTSIEDDLYTSSAGLLLDRLRTVEDDVTSVMLIGHNPGMEDLASMLVGDGDEPLRRKLDTKFPTGGLATLRFVGTWNDLSAGLATLDAFVVPRELT